MTFSVDTLETSVTRSPAATVDCIMMCPTTARTPTRSAAAGVERLHFVSWLGPVWELSVFDVMAGFVNVLRFASWVLAGVVVPSRWCNRVGSQLSRMMRSANVACQRFSTI